MEAATLDAKGQLALGLGLLLGGCSAAGTQGANAGDEPLWEPGRFRS